MQVEAKIPADQGEVLAVLGDEQGSDLLRGKRNQGVLRGQLEVFAARRFVQDCVYTGTLPSTG